MKRLIEKIVFVGLVTAWRLAGAPTRRLPSLVNATTDGVVRLPSRLVMTRGSPPSMTATTELVVPRSMPMILPLLGHGSPSGVLRMCLREQQTACRMGRPIGSANRAWTSALACQRGHRADLSVWQRGEAS